MKKIQLQNEPYFEYFSTLNSVIETGGTLTGDYIMTDVCSDAFVVVFCIDTSETYLIEKK
jgi:hypothetical protein